MTNASDAEARGGVPITENGYIFGIGTAASPQSDFLCLILGDSEQGPWETYARVYFKHDGEIIPDDYESCWRCLAQA